jgi:hypothetical protein
MSVIHAMEAQAVAEEDLLQKANVVGVGVGLKNPERDGNEIAVVVLVEQKKPIAALSAEDLVPPEVNGIRTDVMEVGVIRAQDSRGRFRPIPCGISVGHYKVTAGTLGCIVTDRTTGEKYILSNNHVLANCNDALIGDPILQPASMDGGNNPADVIARLERFIALSYIEGPITAPTPTQPPTTPTQPPTTPTQPPTTPTEPPLPLPPVDQPTQPPTTPTQPPTTTTPTTGCDITKTVAVVANVIASMVGSENRLQVTSTSAQARAAAASVIGSPTLTRSVSPELMAMAADNGVDCALARLIDPTMFSGEILNIGTVSGTKPVTLGMTVRKMGRTTGFTQSTVTLLNATITVAYNTTSGPRTARFVDQVFTTAMSQGGDSGSLIVDGVEDKGVGLLFAGSSQVTVFTPIERVLNSLNVMI